MKPKDRSTFRVRGAGSTRLEMEKLRSGMNSTPKYATDIDYETIGKKLRAERERIGYTQEQVAEVIGITPAFVGHLERGERSMSLDTLIRFCNFYHTTIDYILSDVLPLKEDNTLAQIADIIKDKTPKQQTAILDMLITFTRHV